MNIAYTLGIVIGESSVGKAWIREQTDEDRFDTVLFPNPIILLTYSFPFIVNS